MKKILILLTLCISLISASAVMATQAASDNTNPQIAPASYPSATPSTGFVILDKIIMLNQGGVLDVVFNGAKYDGVTPIDILLVTFTLAVLFFSIRALRRRPDDKTATDDEPYQPYNKHPAHETNTTDTHHSTTHAD